MRDFSDVGRMIDELRNEQGNVPPATIEDRARALAENLTEQLKMIHRIQPIEMAYLLDLLEKSPYARNEVFRLACDLMREDIPPCVDSPETAPRDCRIQAIKIDIFGLIQRVFPIPPPVVRVDMSEGFFLDDPDQTPPPPLDRLLVAHGHHPFSQMIGPGDVMTEPEIALK